MENEIHHLMSQSIDHLHHLSTTVLPPTAAAAADASSLDIISETGKQFDYSHLSHGLSQSILNAAGADAVVTTTATTTTSNEVIEAAAKEGINWWGWWDTWSAFIKSSIIRTHTFLETDLGFANSYGAAIVLFTTMVKFALLPVTYKQLESAQYMQALAPKAKELKKKYGKNKALLNQLTAKLYEDADVNPLAGCLPALAQIPVFIALYRSLLALAQENAIDEPFLWLPSLEGPLFDAERGTQWLTQNWHNGVPSLGWHDTLCYLSIPVILVISQQISGKLLTPPQEIDEEDPKARQQAERTQTILKYLPFMLGYFSLSVPSGLGIYWIWNNVLTTLISLAIKQKFKANPIEIDVDVDKISKEMGLDPSIETLTLPQMISEATANKQPSKENKRELLERLKMTNSAMLGGENSGQDGNNQTTNNNNNNMMMEKDTVDVNKNMKKTNKVLEDVSQ